MIDAVIARWYAVIRGEAELDDLLHKDCVFWSPVLFQPQKGRDLTKLYLTAASQVFPGDPHAYIDDPEGPAAIDAAGFRYTKKVLDGNHAVLEFETTMGGVVVNGVDIITCDDSGFIVEFKVMLRPMKAVAAVRDQMAVMLATLGNT
ncbi:MAG: nuclear transport factor 2 family protein [Acidimicrobiales bacterium]|nr:nuclear transport factor 2 family protein [Acidimicrobiales bacterium]